MSFPFMPFYAGDYYRKTRRLKTAELHGAYLLIIFELWNHGGELPFIEEELAAIAHVPMKRWPYVWSKIGFYFLFGAGIIKHPRVDEELKKAERLSDRRREAGRKGGEAKSLKNKDTDVAEPQQSLANHNHNHTHKEQTVEVERSRTREAACDADAPQPRVIDFPKAKGLGD